MTGLTYGEALATLAELGFVVIRLEVPVTDPAAHDIVIEVEPGAGQWVPIGGSVTVTVGVYDSGGEGEGEGEGV
ncbi:MAG: PASTA domain-containing protein [Acidimicrobiia bacterium]